MTVNDCCRIVIVTAGLIKRREAHPKLLHPKMRIARNGTLEKLTRGYHQLKEDKPGARFLNAYLRSRRHSKVSATTILIIVAGTILIVGGFLLGLIPGVPGIVLGVLGLALIATRFRRMAVWLDRAELKTRRIWQRCRCR